MKIIASDMSKECCIFLLILVGFFRPIQAQFSDYHFDHISNDEGLSGNTVKCIFQDSRGYMWFGTDNGLNRYDGYSIKLYSNDPYDSSTISDSHINKIFEDKSGRMWIGTENGLNLYNRDKETFTRYLSSPNDGNNLRGNDIIEIYEDKEEISGSVQM